MCLCLSVNVCVRLYMYASLSLCTCVRMSVCVCVSVSPYVKELILTLFNSLHLSLDARLLLSIRLLTLPVRPRNAPSEDPHLCVWGGGAGGGGVHVCAFHIYTHRRMYEIVCTYITRMPDYEDAYLITYSWIVV